MTTPDSAARPVQKLQEPEHPERVTGTYDSTVPNLLAESMARPKLELQFFLDHADRSNPTLRQAALAVERARQEARQAKLYPNPTIGYQGDQIRGGSYGGGEQGGFVQQTIVLGGKLGLRSEIAKQQGSANAIGVEEQRARVHGEVSQLFYSALTAQAVADLRGELLNVALDAQKTAHQLSNVGQADAPDVLQSEVEAEQAKIDYVTSQRDYITSFRALSAVAGELDLPLTLLDGSLENVPAVDLNAQLVAIIAGSPSVRRAEQTVLLAEARTRASKREAIPDLTLRAGEQYNGELLNGLSGKQVGAQSFATAAIDLPLWNRNQGNTAAAEADLERARQDVVRTKLALTREAQAAGQAYLSATFEAERYRTELLPRAQRAYELYRVKYEGMAAAYPQVLVSQRTLFQLRVSYLHALGRAWENALSLANFTLSGALESPGKASTPAAAPMRSGVARD